MARGHELLPETCLCRPWYQPKWLTQAPHWSACAWGEGTIISLKPCFPVDSSVTSHSCRPAEGPGFPHHLAAGCLASWFPDSPDNSSANTLRGHLFLYWLHGFPIHQQRTPRLQQWACVLHDQAVAPTVGSGRLHQTNQAFKTWSSSRRHMSR